MKLNMSKVGNLGLVVLLVCASEWVAPQVQMLAATAVFIVAAATCIGAWLVGHVHKLYRGGFMAAMYLICLALLAMTALVLVWTFPGMSPSRAIVFTVLNGFAGSLLFWTLVG